MTRLEWSLLLGPRRALRDRHPFVRRPVALRPEGPIRFEPTCPRAGSPHRLVADHVPRAPSANGGHEALLRAEVADPSAGATRRQLELSRHGDEPPVGCDGRAGHDAVSRHLYV